MRNLRKVVGVRPEGVRTSGGRTNGEGGMSGADVLFWLSQLQDRLLPALDGCDIGVNLPDRSEKLELLLVEGLEIAGERAFRKSV